MNDVKRVYPVLALRGMTLLPGTIVHFDIRRKKSLAAAEVAMRSDQRLFMITQRNPEIMEPDVKELYSVGTIAEIKQLVKLPSGDVRLIVEAEQRAFLVQLDESQKYLTADVEIIENEEGYPDEITSKGMADVIKNLIEKYGLLNKKYNKDILEILENEKNLDNVIMQAANSLPMYYEQKQELLEAADVINEYEILVKYLSDEIEASRIRNELQKKIKAAVDKNQKEYIMREQIKVLRKELGDDTTMSDADLFLEQTNKLKADKKVKDHIAKEIKRFRNMGQNNSEGTVSRVYIETLLDLPWNKSSKDNNDIEHAKEVLDADHYGLEKVKERIIEFLAVRAFTKKKEQSTIICLAGPPGTGKTSIAKSVAASMNRKYVRICLGGVRDEAEIRGHRKTYVGAMPGRIIKSMKEAGVKNPLMLLDEIDKLGNDYKGDPASALLEVLDSEQNSHFTDHYVELPVDLSEVVFIATANDINTIPRPLLDRMEVIEVTSYTDNEKLHIAQEHLVVKQMQKHGLDEKQFSVSSKAIEKLIMNYTREAGVRNLERQIASLCRKAAKEILLNNKKSVKINEKNLSKYLGKEKYSRDLKNEKNEIGIVRGLAWTSVGGDTLEIEVNTMPGKGELKLTGKLGDVMKESAAIALTYVRSIAEEYGVSQKFFEKNDIHVHVPEGAVPKDGPSAGVTMSIAILSAVTKMPVRCDVAMTGEVTLRGRVLPIGGLKEKLLAAKTAGITTVYVPEKNRPDVDEISSEIKKGIDIVFVTKVEEIAAGVLVRDGGDSK